MSNWAMSSQSIGISFDKKNLLIKSFKIVKSTNEIDVNKSFSGFIENIRNNFTITALKMRKNSLFITICCYAITGKKKWESLRKMEKDFQNICVAFLPSDLKSKANSPEEIDQRKSLINIKRQQGDAKYVYNLDFSNPSFISAYEFSNLSTRDSISSELLNGILDIPGCCIKIFSISDKKKFRNSLILELTGNEIDEIFHKQDSVFSILQSAGELSGSTKYINSEFFKANPGRMMLGYGINKIGNNDYFNLIPNIPKILKLKKHYMLRNSNSEIYSIIKPLTLETTKKNRLKMTKGNNLTEYQKLGKYRN